MGFPHGVCYDGTMCVPDSRRRSGGAVPCVGGMTVIELVIAVIVIVLVVSLLMGGARSVRDAAKRTQAAALMGALNRALSAYYELHGAYPPGDASGSAAVALPLLLGSRGPLPEGIDSALVVREATGRTLRDPWGTPLRYITERYAAQPERAALHGGRPVFVSAGPDRNFGDGNARLNADNIGSDDQQRPTRRKGMQRKRDNAVRLH